MSRPPVIYVDVDDTLVRSFGASRIPNAPLIANVRQWAVEGCILYCWSSGGAEYAEKSARELGIAGCFKGFLPKPEVLIDDMPIAKWHRLMEILPANASSMTADEVKEALEHIGW